jgi:hypothetical protein
MRHTANTAIVLILLAALCAGGCAANSAEERPEIDRARVFYADFDTVWAQLLSAVTTGEETLTLVDKSTGFISFQKDIPVKQLDKYAFDDSGMLISTATANMVIKVRAENQRRIHLVMNTKITAIGKSATDVLLSRERKVVLDSKGWLEREYFDRLSATLKGARAKPD